MSINTARYQFVAEALNGDGGFLPTIIRDANGKPTAVRHSHLVQYPRESEAKFARRNEVAWYENHLLPAVQRFVGYLAKKPPMRDLPNPLLESVAEDCNWRGDDLDVFWQSFMTEAKSRGCMLLLVDMPRVLPTSEAAQIEQRAVPYLVPLKPEAVIKYQLNTRGRVSFIEYGDTLDDGTAVVRGWDESDWWVRKGEDVLEADTHNLGICPVLAFSESGAFPFVGPFAQIADLSKRLFNARSELDEILRSQTFSLLTYHVPPEMAATFGESAGKIAEAIGTHNMLVHNGNAPSFIAPSDGPANTYLATIAHIEQAINRVSLAIEIPAQQSQESGLALTIRFQALNAALTGFARRMEDLENQVWGVVARWLKLSTPASAQWAKDFALADIATELQTLASMIAAGMPPEVVTEQKKVITQLAFPALPQADMQALLDAIDIGGSEVPGAANDPNNPQTLDPVTGDPVAPVGPTASVDLAPVMERLAAIEASITAGESNSPAPVINVTVPEPVVNVQVDAPQINVTVPEQPAPIVNVTPAPITVQAPQVNVTVPEQPAAPAPSVTLNTGTNGRVINLVRDGQGNITGATVEGAQ